VFTILVKVMSVQEKVWMFFQRSVTQIGAGICMLLNTPVETSNILLQINMHESLRSHENPLVDIVAIARKT
jgi:hypothetical protein